MGAADTTPKGTEVSDPGDSIDQLVEAASVPNLAALFKQGKKAGLIQPTTGYGEGAPPAP